MFIKRFILASTSLLVIFIPITAIAEENLTDNSMISREDRLKNAVQSQNLVLDDSARLNIVLKCQNSQAILKGVQSQSDTAIRQREDTYNNIQKEVKAIKIRMARQGSDASEADLFLGRMQDALDQFTLTADKYGTSLNDSINVDCQSNPEYFMASLVLMRGHRSKLYTTTSKLQTIVRNSIMDTFEPLKKRLTI